MAASDHHNPPRQARPPRECLSAAELAERLDEEVVRAERQHTELSCLLVSVQDVQQLADLHGAQLPDLAIAYLGGALERQLRRYDRVGRPSQGELLVVLPGADQRRGEIVARRALGRMHAIKLELDGVRRPLRISVGIAAWQLGFSGEQLLAHARLAAHAGNGRASVPGALFPAPQNAQAEDGGGRSSESAPLGRS